jgi:hypothetical protein
VRVPTYYSEAVDRYQFVTKKGVPQLAQGGIVCYGYTITITQCHTESNLRRVGFDKS